MTMTMTMMTTTLLETDAMIKKMRASTLRAMRAETEHLTLDATRQNLETLAETVRWVETFPLTHFFTLTFGQPTSEALAVKRVLQWQDRLERLNKTAIGLFFGLEATPAVHAHGVLIGNPDVSSRHAEHEWRTMAGNPKVSRYEPGRGGVAYTLKEAFWTRCWDFEHLEFYSPEVRMRRSRRTRELFFHSLTLPAPAASC